ncbi:phospholipid-binding protein MlaC [Pontibacterium sp.]|jgi:phospholipid transport system substrate-binding protein|uniref:MlaC/ttg2D family ABC transporter substrate-binding protein n=1 Tax=Pontibacterium sp. TaxID=2036026 RepID=UPI0035688A29
MLHYQRYFRSLIVFFVVTLGIGHAAAETPNNSAKAFISQIATQLQQALQSGRDLNRLGDNEYLDQIIDQYILPHIDQEYLSRRIFHPRWKDIIAADKTAEAQMAVIKSLRRTYRIALNTYNGQMIEVGKSRDKPSYSVVRLKVHTTQNAHTLDFAIRETDGQWQVFDLSVDGVVLSKTLNGAIHRTLESGDVDAVIAAINPPDES